MGAGDWRRVPASEFDLTRDFAYALQLSLGCVFLLAAIPKVSHPAAFARTVADYRLVPRAVARALAPVFIAAECFLALAFLTGWKASARKHSAAMNTGASA